MRILKITAKNNIYSRPLSDVGREVHSGAQQGGEMSDTGQRGYDYE
jgi:hypothetical protein